MAVRAIISKRLENDVIVDIKSPKAPTKQYKVPAQVADEFCRSYVKRDKKETLISNLSFFGAVLGGCLLITPLSKKVENGAGRMTLGIIAGILAAVGANFLTVAARAPKQKQFIDSFNAVEIEKTPMTTSK